MGANPPNDDAGVGIGLSPQERVEIERRGRTFEELASSPEMQKWYDKGWKYFYWTWKKDSIVFSLLRDKTLEEKIADKRAELDVLLAQKTE